MSTIRFSLTFIFSFFLVSVHGITLTQEFNLWKNKYNVFYESPEHEDFRLSVWIDSYFRIEEHNSQNHSWTMAMNHFGDLTPHEFKSTMSSVPLSSFSSLQPLFQESFENLPYEVDWVAEDRVTPVKNQGHCGSCWSFSATGAIESAWAIFSKNHTLYSLSEQQLVDCSTSFGNQGCDGGMMDDAFKYVVSSQGLCLESAYPYQAEEGTCHASSCKAYTRVLGFHDVTPLSPSSLMKAVARNPVSVAIEADQSAFQFYSGGVMTAPCGTNLDHGVLVVGYGTLNGTDYWKIKNSWGTSWGEDGYILLARSTDNSYNNGKGQCGILMAPSYPLVLSE